MEILIGGNLIPFSQYTKHDVSNVLVHLAGSNLVLSPGEIGDYHGFWGIVTLLFPPIDVHLMGNWTRRRALQAAGIGLIGALAGCSALSDSERTFLVAVNNYTESRHEGTVLIESDGTEVVRQYLEIPAAEPDGWATVETEITLGSMASDTALDVTASFGDMKATGQHALGCSSSNQYHGDVIYVQIEPKEDGPNLRLNLACYDEFPSSEAVQGGINQS